MWRKALLLILLSGWSVIASAQTTVTTTDRLRVGPGTVPIGAVPIRIGVNANDYCDVDLTTPGGVLTLDCSAGVSQGLVFSDPSSFSSTLSVTLGATFSSTVDLKGNVSDSTGAISLTDDVDITGSVADSTGDLTLGDDVDVTGTLDVTSVIYGSSTVQHPSWASQTSNWGITSAGAADFRYLFVDEMHAKSFIADLEQALAGGQIISKSVAMVSQTFTCPTGTGTATLWVRDLPSAANMAAFDQTGPPYDNVVLRSFSRSGGALTIADCVGTVSAYSDGSGGNEGQQSWTFTRNSAGGTMTGGATVAVDAIVLDMGESGNGFYEVNAIDGTYGANSPYAQVVTWTTSPVAANRSVRARYGNLKGITSTTEYGLLAGTYNATAGRYFRASDQNFELHGIDLSMWDADSINIALRANSSNPYLSIGNPAPTSYAQTSSTGVFLGSDSGTYKVRIGTTNSSGVQTAGLTWDGSTLLLGGAAAAADGSRGRVTITSGGLVQLWDGAGAKRIELAADGSSMLLAPNIGTTDYPRTRITGGSVFIDAASGTYLQMTGTALSFVSSSTTMLSMNNSGSITVGRTGAGQSNVTIVSDAVKLRTAEADKIVLDTSGNITLTGSLSVGTSGYIANGTTTWGSGAGFFLGYDSTLYKFRIGDDDTTGDRLVWDGDNLTLASANLTINSSGIVLAAGTATSDSQRYRFSGDSCTDTGMAYDTDDQYAIIKGCSFVKLRGGSVDYNFYGSPASLHPMSTADLGTVTYKWQDIILSRDIFFGPTGTDSAFEPLVFDTGFNVIRTKTDGFNGTCTSLTSKTLTIEKGIIVGCS